MKPTDLRAEVAIEFGQMERVVEELAALRRDVGTGEPTYREKTAAGSFLGQFYMGVENVLKRLSKYHGVALPEGAKWHADLLSRFGGAGHEGLPSLLDDALADGLDAFRGFRHVTRATYGFDLDWTRMTTGIEALPPVFDGFRTAVAAHLAALGEPLDGPDATEIG